MLDSLESKVKLLMKIEANNIGQIALVNKSIGGRNKIYWHWVNYQWKLKEASYIAVEKVAEKMMRWTFYVKPYAGGIQLKCTRIYWRGWHVSGDSQSQGRAHKQGRVVNCAQVSDLRA